MKYCLKIGEVNRIGFKKVYSCSEFSQIDKNFIRDKWCDNCRVSNRILLDNMWYKVSIESKIPTSSKIRGALRIEDKQNETVIYLPIDVLDTIIFYYKGV